VTSQEIGGGGDGGGGGGGDGPHHSCLPSASFGFGSMQNKNRKIPSGARGPAKEIRGIMTAPLSSFIPNPEVLISSQTET
jgi:hypothetical protein